MTNDELKALCGRVIETCERMRDIGLPLLIGDSAISLSQECLKLLAQCDAMRGVVEAARKYFTEDLEAGIDLNPKYFKSYNAVKVALSQLGERT